EALERAAQRITQGGGKAHARLRIVLQILQHGARQIQILAAEDGKLSCLVVADLVAEDGETELQGTIKHVGLGEAKHRASRQVSQADLHLQGFAASQEVVRGIVQSDECSFQT